MTGHNESLWDIGPVISKLRDTRNHSLALRNRENNPPKLPNRKVLREILENLATVLYPNRLGEGGLTASSIDYFVGNTLEFTLMRLLEQAEKELVFTANEGESPSADNRTRAIAIIREFTQTLPNIRKKLDTDLEAAYEGDPAARSVDEVLVCYPGISAITCHRIAHELFGLGLPLIARMISEIAHSDTGIDIHPGAHIGGSFFIDHGTGVVIGETAIIGERVRLYQAVTLGAKRFPTDENGVLLKGNARHPIVEDDVVIYAGATILGRITIGRGSTIGGNVWLTRSVPPDSNITQAQAKQELFIHGAGI
jgi:serine O-acetyltransferase